jgi:hypothetical protein
MASNEQAVAQVLAAYNEGPQLLREPHLLIAI